jgi:cellulose synthase operon protein C
LRFFPSLAKLLEAGATRRRVAAGALLLAGACGGYRAKGELPEWVREVVGASAIESALYRLMEMPGGEILYPRPPAESRGELSNLLEKTPADGELYALRARVDEQSLDFTAAESDWKLYVAHAQDVPAAKLDVADFYHRRLRSQEEIATLLLIGGAPSTAAEKFTPAQQQRSWRAFERVLKVTDDQALPIETKVSTYRAWIVRYPDERSLYAALMNLLIERQRFDEASGEIAEYKRAFPHDEVFPLKAAALIAYRSGSPERAVAIYETSFRPLWPAELVQSYFAILSTARQQRRILSDAREKLILSPDDLAAAVRIFYYYQQEGRLDEARRAIDEYRFSKDRRKAAWSAEELYTFATLLDRANQYDEAARYYFALYSAEGTISAGRSPQEVALAAIVRILLTAPDQGIALASGNLSIYSDIATVDSGPGYLNGILSLWLNSESPRQEFSEEEKRGLPYFHRAKAAELLALLDTKFPTAAARADLNAELIRAFAEYGQDAVVIKAGGDFLEEYRDSPRRVAVAMMMADAYARTNNAVAEFALYDRMLSELAARSGGMPLTASAASAPADAESTSANQAEGAPERTIGEATTAANENAAKPTIDGVLTLTVLKPVQVLAPDELTYGQLLDRYLGRLTTDKRLPEALAVLRRELDRNPNDPLLYERLADFLQQNNFTSQEEEVYRRAIERFNSRDWYDRLARLFIREKRRQDYSALTHQVVDTFRGTELESHFRSVNGGWPQISLEVNLYAHQRFPHDTTFTLNLLRAYRSRDTADAVAWEKLMREHWFESPQLTNEFFDYLSSTGKLDGEIAALRELLPTTTKPQESKAAMRALAEADLWQSHFEQSAPLLGSLASDYPADAKIGNQASSVYRSLAYFDPSSTAHAVSIEKNLLAYDPADLERLARIGDILADNSGGDARQIAAAAPYWRRMASVHPGLPDGYLQSATVFWDYFQFDDALEQIATARKQFHDPAMYGYEAGAIYENERETGKAVGEYVTAAVTGNSAARDRLITLAARPASAQLVGAASAKAVADDPTLLAIGLRADILARQKQSAEITALVNNAVDGATTFDEAERLASFAQQRNLAACYRHALRREVALASDPVQRIEIQYSLVQSLVAMGDVASAGQIIDAVYKDNSRIIGVVRTTTDFYWEHKQPGKAIATLTQASREAYPELARSYTFEAAEKSNESGDYELARQMVTPLLDADPYGPNSARCLAIVADSYARANDDADLRDFYLAKLAALKSAKLSTAERRDQAALLRRGLILALTRMKDHAGAVDQQIALISAFPEDSGVIQDAALYALRYGRQQQLLDFLNQAIADSPRDSRFAIALGSVDTLFEDYPGAIDAYGKAIAIRKDRNDIYIARADLEERLQRFDDACADYDKLYFLSYKDPQWMVRAAEARARQGKNAEAVQALQTAWVDGRPAEAANYFRVAEQLDQWSLLDAASGFAEQGVKQAGDDLLAAGANHHGAAIYARILARQRHSGEAMKTLEKALGAADVSPSSPAVVLQQAEEQGIAAVSDAEWRRNRIEQRKQQAQAGFKAAVQQMSAAVATYYTPEEKLTYARLLDGREAQAAQDDVVSIWIPAAMTAGLKDREAWWSKDVLLGEKAFDDNKMNAFSLLEKQRMENAERGNTLETYAGRYLKPNADLALALAEGAWRDEAKHARELAVLRRMDIQNKPQASLRERYFELLLRSEPNKLVEQASSDPSDYADAATNYLLAKGTQSLAYAGIDARAGSLQPVWREANTALAGLYFSDKAPAIDTAFQTALDHRNIGERVSTKADTRFRLTGNSWFYYGMRYGVYRSFIQEGMKTSDAEDYLASGLEGAPEGSSSYVSLAQAYIDAKETQAAMREYGHALELAPNSAAIHRDTAVLLWSTGRKDEAGEAGAIGHWKQALEVLRQLVDTRVVPESFWSDFAAIAGDCHQRELIGELRPQMDAVLRAYIAKNGDYRSVELLHSALIASASPSDGVDWILSLAEAARYSETLLAQLDGEAWLPRQQLGRVLRRELELAQAASPQADDSSDYLSGRARRIRIRLFQYLVEEKQDAEAQAFYESIPAKERLGEEFQRARIVLAAHQGQIPKLLADFPSNPDIAPSTTTIAAAASELRASGDRASNRLLLEYVFDFKSVRHELADADFLALAQARLETGDVAGAVDLLHRFTLFAPDLYGSLDSAAGLLEKSGHPAEALPFLSTLANGTPWKPEYRLRLATARLRAQAGSGAQDTQSVIGDLTSVASSAEAGYAVRVRAAIELKGRGGARDLYTAELALLASGKAIPPELADQPYFLPARVAAAASAPAAAKPAILRKAIAVAPSDSLRLGIFRAEFALEHSELAFAAIQPLLESPGGYVQTPGADASVTSDSDSAEGDADGRGGSVDESDENSRGAQGSDLESAETTDGAAAYAPVPSLLKTRKEKVDFALAVATLYEHAGNDEQALTYARFAARLNDDSGRRAEIARRTAALWLRARTERENSSRRPAIHESLDQVIVVRPRIGDAASRQVQP